MAEEEFAWTEALLAEHLFGRAAARAHQEGRNFGEGTGNDLRQLTAQGAHNLLTQPQNGGFEMALQKAEADIVRLIEMAIGNARALEDYDPQLLGERTYFPARFRFCPCHPFC